MLKKQENKKTYAELHHTCDSTSLPSATLAYLVNSVLFDSLLLVKAGQASVVPLVELPRVDDRDVHLRQHTSERNGQKQRHDKNTKRGHQSKLRQKQDIHQNHNPRTMAQITAAAGAAAAKSKAGNGIQYSPRVSWGYRSRLARQSLPLLSICTTIAYDCCLALYIHFVKLPPWHFCHTAVP